MKIRPSAVPTRAQIVVTAGRRDEVLSKVPAVVVALNADLPRQYGVEARIKF